MWVFDGPLTGFCFKSTPQELHKFSGVIHKYSKNLNRLITSFVLVIYCYIFKMNLEKYQLEENQ
jgi:hypothetical protein